MIYILVILDMNDSLILEEGFALESCDFLMVLLKKIFYCQL